MSSLSSPNLPTSDYAYHYRKWHNESEDHFLNMSTYFEKKFKSLDVIKSGEKVLEIGCGWGFALGGLRNLGITDVEGYDIDPVAVDLCNRRGFNVSLLSLPEIGAYMERRRGAYDAVLAFDVIEHVPVEVRKGILRDAFLALKPGGLLVCQVPNADSVIATHMRYVDHTHVTSFTQTSLDAILHDVGFEPANFHNADPVLGLKLGRGGNFKVWAIHNLVRKLMRAIYVAELGSWEGYRILLDKNIIAVARRPL